MTSDDLAPEDRLAVVHDQDNPDGPDHDSSGGWPTSVARAASSTWAAAPGLPMVTLCSETLAAENAR